MKHRTSSDSRERIVVGLHVPQQLAGCGVDRVHIGGTVADERGVAWSGFGFDAPDADSCAHSGGGLKVPMTATGGGGERVDIAALTPHEYTATCNRGLCV